MTALARWRTLSGDQRRLLIAAAMVLPLHVMAVRLVSFSRLTARLGPLQPPAAPAAISTDWQAMARQIGWAIAAVARRLPADPTCLARALAAQRLCARYEIPARLHLGARRGQEVKAETHAWLDAGGVPVTGYPLPADMVEVGFFG